MNFHGLFIGIDRYADTKIQWLSGAVRDAKALHALFADTISDESHVLLTDKQATASAIRSALQKLSNDAKPDDVVVIYYAGHGSDTHEIICYDTLLSDISSTSLPLEELGEVISGIKGRTVFCALDCCFSGGLGSRVLATGIKERGLAATLPSAILQRFTGKGRLVLTASADDEPALESSTHGHGLFTFRLLEALQGAEDVAVNDQLDLQKLVHYVSQRVIADAAQMGRQQTPTLRGQLDGVPLWPLFKPGSRYSALFPDRVRQPATADPSSLSAYGISDEVLHVWAANIKELNELQLRAINEFGVLDYENVVVTAPTSSGKTMIGELAAVKAATTRGRTVFLLPMKALVNDKYEHFVSTYAAAGIKTIRATGDYSDQVSELMRGQFDFAILTYEKFTALALANPHILALVSVVVVDEAQTLTDKTRGSNLEFLLTMINNRRGQDGSPQLITLSAVVGDLGGLDRWISGKNLHTDQRPVPLREGVMDRSGTLRYLDESGNEQSEPRFITPLFHDGSRSVVIPLVQRLIQEHKKVIVFRQSKSEAIACATYLSTALNLPAVSQVLESLAIGEPSASSNALQRTLSAGIAFHTADLDRTERQVLEAAFRDPDSGLDVIVATPTLAMGVNTPASAVIIVGLTHPGAPPTPYTVAEYKNMVGRAGRLGFAEAGESYLVPEGALDPGRSWSHYVNGELEPLKSQLVPDGDPRTLMLRVLAQYQTNATGTVSEQDVIGFLDSSLAAFQAREGGNAQWDTDRLRRSFDQLVQAQLIERTTDGYQLTTLGRFAGQSGVHVDSIIKLAEMMRHVDTSTLKSTGLIAATQVTNELDDYYIAANLKGKNTEHVRWWSTLQQQDVPAPITQGMQRTADQTRALRRAKRAASTIMWINGVQMAQLEATLNQHIWNRPEMAGVVRSVADRTRDLLPAVAAVLYELHPASRDQVAVLIERTSLRLEFGVPPQLIDLAAAGGGLTRTQLLALNQAGISTPALVIDAPEDTLTNVIGSREDADLLVEACREFVNQEAATNIDLPKPLE
ncbi:caspase family protein [Mycolicibacterium sp. Y3]